MKNPRRASVSAVMFAVVMLGTDLFVNKQAEACRVLRAGNNITCELAL